MPQLLIKAQSATHTATNPAARWQKGDIVRVDVDSKKYGKEECWPKFLVVRMAVGTTMAQAKALREPKLIDGVLPGQHIILSRSRFKFDIDANLTAQDIKEIEESNWVVKEYVLGKVVEKA